MKKNDLPRIDQDIHFVIGAVPVVMHLDTGAPYKYWIIRPERDDQGAALEAAARSVFAGCPGVYIQPTYVTIADEDEPNVLAQEIMFSSPDWDGQSLSGFSGREALAHFLREVEAVVGKTDFRRGDGSPIVLDV